MLYEHNSDDDDDELLLKNKKEEVWCSCYHSVFAAGSNITKGKLL